MLANSAAWIGRRFDQLAVDCAPVVSGKRIPRGFQDQGFQIWKQRCEDESHRLGPLLVQLSAHAFEPTHTFDCDHSFIQQLKHET